MNPSVPRSLEDRIVSVCKLLHAKGMLAAADGNVSARLSDQEILMTPSGQHKGFIHPEDLAVITLDGRIIRGNPSSERAMHLEIYRSASQAQAVVHAHPPTAIAWSVARPELTELPSTALSEVILAAGRIPFAPYARPGTESMGQVLRPLLPDHRIIVLSRHGALSWGESLEEAYNGMERLEHSAEILFKAQLLGGITELPQAEVDFLRLKRRELGPKTL